MRDKKAAHPDLTPLAERIAGATDIAATGLDTLSNSFLGVPVEICIATRSAETTMKALVDLGIGPWGLYQFNERTVSDRRSYGEPDPYVINVAFARNGPIIWELMEPVVGAATLWQALEDREQALHSGEVNVPLHDGALQRERIHAALGEILAGSKTGRDSDTEITVFDSTGLAVQDVALARLVYERAKQSDIGIEVSFFE